MPTTIIFLFIIAVIGFNIWNVINLKNLLKRPLKNDQLNDKNYWELKYKMQFMVTVFSVILAVAAYLGFNTIEDVKESVRKDFQSKLDSTEVKIKDINSQLSASKSSFDSKIATNDSSLSTLATMLYGVQTKTNLVQNSLLISSNQLDTFRRRFNELIQKNLYISFVRYSLKDPTLDDVSQTVLFSELKTTSGDKLPSFSKPPLIIATSNEGVVFQIDNVTSTSFRLQPFITPGELQTTMVTIFIQQIQ